MAIEVGAKGLQEVNLTIPQKTSLSFEVVHKDEDGNVVDHSQSTAHMAFQTSDKETTYDLDSCCSCSDERIRVTIPAATSTVMPLGKMAWDMMVDTVMGETIRLCFGKASIVDTYAKDDEV